MKTSDYTLALSAERVIKGYFAHDPAFSFPLAENGLRKDIVPMV